MRRLVIVAGLLWLVGCVPSLEVDGKDGCLSHADCLGGAVCVQVAGASEGRCTPSGGASLDAGVGGGDGGADASGEDASAGEDAASGEDAGEPGCSDEDRDGYGPGCSLGPDCDDSVAERNPAVAERCDAIDWNCDGDPMGGLDLSRDVEHCGGCGRACEGGDAIWACVGGECAVERCLAGHVDANGDPRDGCEGACVATAEREVVCTDGVDDDCDSVVDGADPDCAVSRALEGRWSGLHLVRGTGPQQETITQAQLVSVGLEGMSAQVSTTWVGSPPLEGSGSAVNSLAVWQVRDQGAGRYTLASAQTGETLRGFASREGAPSWLMALPIPARSGVRVWSRALWAWTRESSAPASRFVGDYEGAVFRGRGRSLGGLYAYEPTWSGDYAMQATGGNSRLVREQGASGRPTDDGLYPLALTLGQSASGSWWMQRERTIGWDVGYHGELGFEGSAGLFAIFDRFACERVEVETRSCPPEAGLGLLVRPDAAGAHALVGRWALLGVWLSQQATSYVSGIPTFLGVEVEVTPELRLVGAGEFEVLRDLGRAEQAGASVRLEVAGLPPSEDFEPSALNLEGVLSADGNVALLLVDGPDGPGPGVFWLMRL